MNPNQSAAVQGSRRLSRAYRFVLLIGVLSFFADFAYEGSRSVTGPFLALLGASGTIAGVVGGLGELFGYGLRLFSGRLSERTQQFWPITIVGYFIQMSAVPALAFAANWGTAAALILAERIGKAIRNPPRDVMLSHAAKEIGYGWAFGVHEALDQSGALVGPLLVAAILAHRGSYRLAFSALLIPALVTLTLVLLARWLYPRPEDLEPETPDLKARGLPRVFWTYLVGAALVAAGFADYQLIAFHFQKDLVVRADWIPVLYAIAMGVSGTGSLLFGKFFDRKGFLTLIPVTFLSALSAPLVFSSSFTFALVGAALWGLGTGVHESIVPAAVASMVHRDRRPSAYGIFTGLYGVSWFAGSALLGILYDVSVPALVVVSVCLQLAAIPMFIKVQRLQSKTAPG
jgi:predicted MFS family arabinose efflux permease